MARSKDEPERDAGKREGSPARKAKVVRYDEVQKYDPFRKLSWRWQRAQQLVNDGEPISAKTDDAWTRRAAKYLQAQARCKTGHQRAALLRRMPDIIVAHQLSEQEEIRWLAEARLLAEQDVAEIARHVGVEPAAIIAYEALFFNVLDRLKCVDYIAFAAFGRKYHYDKLTMNDKDVLLRMFAYFGGAPILKFLAPYILDPTVDLSLLSPMHAKLAPKIRWTLAMETTRFTWATDAESEKIFRQGEPPTIDDVVEMMKAATSEGRSDLRPLKSKAKIAQVTVEPAEPAQILLGSGSGEG
jgi:hypothetical protein